MFDISHLPPSQWPQSKPVTLKPAQVIFKHVADKAVEYASVNGVYPTAAVNHVLETHFIRPDLIDDLHEYVFTEIAARQAEESFCAHNEFEDEKTRVIDHTDPNG